MAHWGWYWKIKKKHKRKRQCSGFSTIDSFDMFRNKAGVQACMGKLAYEMPKYNLKATLHEDHYHVQYNAGSYKIPIEKQPCNYGGFRYFFHCPDCDKRMRILYCKEGKFLCRKCLELCYFTQILRPSFRCLMMSRAIKRKLYSMAGSMVEKPPWMKRKTFERLRAQVGYYDARFGQEYYKELRQWYCAKTTALLDGYFEEEWKYTIDEYEKRYAK